MYISHVDRESNKKKQFIIWKWPINWRGEVEVEVIVF